MAKKKGTSKSKKTTPFTAKGKRGPSITIRYPFDSTFVAATVPPSFTADGACQPPDLGGGTIQVSGTVFNGTGTTPVSNTLTFTPTTGHWYLTGFVDLGSGMPLTPGTYRLRVDLDDISGPSPANLATHVVVFVIA